jgi:RND family efflux transporter MFP subunit
VPFLGQPVRRGELVASVTPTSTVTGISHAEVELEVTRAQAELGLAERELKRNEELLAAQAIPEKQLDAARTGRQIAAARLVAAERQRALYRGAQVGGSARAGRGAFELRAPFDGVVAFADVTPGAVVEAGTRLVTVVNTDRLWLEAKVYENDAARLQRDGAANAGATFTVSGLDQEFVVDARTGKRIAVGAVVDRATRTVPVIFELANPDGLLKPGMFAKVNLMTGDSVRGLAVPEAAVVDDNGRPVVFVMEGGESFFKRVIRPGVRAGGFVQVEEGVKEGERVVTEGAYEIKLSTASGAIPEHGHEH